MIDGRIANIPRNVNAPTAHSQLLPFGVPALSPIGMPLLVDMTHRNSIALGTFMSIGREALLADNDLVRKLRRFGFAISDPKLQRNRWCGFLHCAQFPAQHCLGSLWQSWKHLKHRNCCRRISLLSATVLGQLYVGWTEVRQIWHGL